jgi:hypothetical protein
MDIYIYDDYLLIKLLVKCPPIILVFGTPEYPAALFSGIEQERVFKYIVISNETDISANYYRVYEDGSKVTTTVDRIADDDANYDLTCVTKNVPTSNCQGRNYALERAQFR